MLGELIYDALFNLIILIHEIFEGLDHDPFIDLFGKFKFDPTHTFVT